MARRKYKTLEEIWDSNREKLLVMGIVTFRAILATLNAKSVLDARGLASPKGVEAVFAQIVMGNAKYKTKTLKRAGTAPQWDELFFLSVLLTLDHTYVLSDKLLDKLTISISGKALLSSTFMCADVVSQC